MTVFEGETGILGGTNEVSIFLKCFQVCKRIYLSKSDMSVRHVRNYLTKFAKPGMKQIKATGLMDLWMILQCFGLV